jgi:CheY-like chemotaxis protein
MQPQGNEGKSILVAEDDDATRRTLATLLGVAGYAVTSVANGREALDSLRRQPTDLILLDLTMPVVDGWQFLKEQRQDSSLASIPVVVVSGAAGADQKADSLGVEALLRKPVELNQLLAAVRGFLTRQKPGILVVDDESAIRKVLGIVLSRHGFSVWTAAGGGEAVALFRQHQGSIGLVLLDVRMPGMDGPQTSRRSGQSTRTSAPCS